MSSHPVFDPYGRFSHFIDARDVSPAASRVAREPAGSGEGSFPLPSCDAAGRCSSSFPAPYGPAETRTAPGYSRHDLGPGAVNAPINLDACFEMVDVVELGEGRA